MPNVSRKGDANSAGGVITGPCAPTVIANGQPVSLPNDLVTPHPCCGAPGCGVHCSAKTTGGSATVYAEGKPIILIGDVDTCGHARSTGAPTVFARK